MSLNEMLLKELDSVVSFITHITSKVKLHVKTHFD